MTDPRTAVRGCGGRRTTRLLYTYSMQGYLKRMASYILARIDIDRPGVRDHSGRGIVTESARQSRSPLLAPIPLPYPKSPHYTLKFQVLYCSVYL